MSTSVEEPKNPYEVVLSDGRTIIHYPWPNPEQNLVSRHWCYICRKFFDGQEGFDNHMAFFHEEEKKEPPKKEGAK